MFRLGVMALLILCGAPFAAAKSKHFFLRVHAQGNANDGAVFASPVTGPSSGKPVFIEKIPTISERDVTGFRAYPATDGSFGAVFQLDDHGRLALETLSIEHRGSTLLVLANGGVVTELLIDRRVSDGQLYIASGLMGEEIEQMKQDWPQSGAKRRR